MAYSANKEPTGLTALTSLETSDVFIVGDASDPNEVAKKITKANLITDLSSSFGAGNVTKVGTPADNQVGVWTGDGTIEGDAALTFDTATDTLAIAASGKLNFGAVNILTDTTGTTTLANIDAIDATTEATIEAAIDALSGVVLTSPTITTGITPTTNDGAALGAATTGEFSDLFLAEGGVINWDNGDATITQTNNDITFAGVSTVGMGTSTALTVGTIELGHASANTLSASGGVLSVEGNAVLTVAGGTMTGNITLGENTSLDYDPSLSADGKYTGIAITGTSGEALAFGDIVTLADSSGKWWKADVSGAVDADSDARNLLGVCVLAAVGADAATKVLLHGVVKADTNFPALTVGKPVYVSTTGDITQTQPSTTDHVIRIIGYPVPDATSATAPQSIFFNPDFTWTTHV